MMTETVQAIYENGVLRPLSPLNLREEEQVTLTLARSEDGIADWEDGDCYEACKKEADESVTLEQVQKALSKIPGSLTVDFIAERDER
jgi:predicted DNA-binding antitoxin AbrB/MazE fold protein